MATSTNTERPEEDREVPEAPEPWVRIGTVARHFSVARRTASNWTYQGCPSMKTNPRGDRRYRLSEVEAWLKARGENPEASEPSAASVSGR